MDAGIGVAAACRPRSKTASKLWLLPVVMVPPLTGMIAISPPAYAFVATASAAQPPPAGWMPKENA